MKVQYTEAVVFCEKLGQPHSQAVTRIGSNNPEKKELMAKYLHKSSQLKRNNKFFIQVTVTVPYWRSEVNGNIGKLHVYLLQI